MPVPPPSISVNRICSPLAVQDAATATTGTPKSNCVTFDPSAPMTPRRCGASSPPTALSFGRKGLDANRIVAPSCDHSGSPACSSGALMIRSLLPSASTRWSVLSPGKPDSPYSETP